MTKLQMVLGGSVVMAMVALVGCGKNKLVVATEEFAQKVCDCKDADCASKAADEYKKKTDELKDSRGSEADAKAIEDAGKKAAECTIKLALKGLGDMGKEGDKKADKKEEKKDEK